MRVAIETDNDATIARFQLGKGQRRPGVISLLIGTSFVADSIHGLVITGIISEFIAKVIAFTETDSKSQFQSWQPLPNEPKPGNKARGHAGRL